MLADSLHLGYFWFCLSLLAACAGQVVRVPWLFVPAVAALLTALSAALVALTSAAQTAVFLAALSAAEVVYLRYFYVPLPRLATQSMAKRAGQLLGHQVSLMRGVKAGKSKIQAANAVWPVRCEQSMPAGTLVEVIGFDGIELQVKRVGVGKP